MERGAVRSDSRSGRSRRKLEAIRGKATDRNRDSGDRDHVGQQGEHQKEGVVSRAPLPDSVCCHF